MTKVFEIETCGELFRVTFEGRSAVSVIRVSNGRELRRSQFRYFIVRAIREEGFGREVAQ